MRLLRLPCAALLLLGTAAGAQPGGSLGTLSGAAPPGQSSAAPAQAAEAPAQQLQSLLTAQQTAVSAGDPASILAASRPAAALALRLAAELDLAGSRLPAARDLLRRSFALDPQTGTGLLLLSAELRDGQTADAQALAASLLASSGESAGLHLRLAQTFQAAGDLDDTIRQLTAALALDPQIPGGHLALGSAFWQLNQFQYNADSLREFTEAQRLDPRNFLANLDLASVLSQYHRFPEADRYFKLAAEADPTSPDPSFQMGMNRYAEDDLPAARPLLERAVALTGSDLAHNSYQIRRAFAVLSRMAALAGQPEKARLLADREEQLHQRLLAEGRAPTLTLSTGLLVGGSSAGVAHPTASPTPASAPGATPPNTAALHQQLLTVAASSLNDAGTALARTHDYAGALPLFREAAAADPTLSPVLRNLGLAAFHTGAFAEAADALTRALARDPGDALAQRYLDQARAAEPPARQVQPR